MLRRELDGTTGSLMGGSASAVVDAAARGARLDGAVGIAVDAAGNVYVTEATGHRLRRITPFGILTTTAGDGTAGGGGDGGLATAARLNKPGPLVLAGTDLVFTMGGTTSVRRIRNVAETVRPVAAVVVNGGGQSASIGSALQAAIGVRVVDNLNRPIAGALVTPAAAAGAAVEPAALRTDNNGIASFTGFVGQTPGALGFTFTVVPPDNRAPPGGPFVAAATAVDVAAGTVITLANQIGSAGTGSYPNAATRQRLSLSSLRGGSVVVDASGAFYFADTNNHRVLKIARNGEGSVVAGTGSTGNTGDGASALTAQLNTPFGVARDAAGNLYISDNASDVIRVVRPSGVIERFAGGGPAGGSNGDGLIATSANLSGPAALVLSRTGDALFVVEDGRHQIRRIAMAAPGVPGAISTVVVGRACSSTTGPVLFTLADSALTIDGDGRLIVSGALASNGSCAIANGEYVVRVEDDGRQTPLLGGETARVNGPAADTTITAVGGLAHDVAGNLYVFEHGNSTVVPRLRRIDHLGRMTTLAAPTAVGLAGDYGPLAAARFNDPAMMTFRGNDLVVVDRDNHAVRLVRELGRTAAETATLSLVSGNNQQGTIHAFLGAPLVARVVDGNGVNVAGVPVQHTVVDPGDLFPGEVLTTNTSGQSAATLRIGLRPGTHTVRLSAKTWLTPRELPGSPQVVTFTAVRPPAGSLLTVVNQSGTAGLSATGGRALDTKLSLSGGDQGGVVAFSDGTIIVADSQNNRVLTVLPEGIVELFSGASTTGGFSDNVAADEALLRVPTSITIDADDDVVFADRSNLRVRRVDAVTNGIQVYAGGGPNDPANGLPPTAAAMNPLAVAVSPIDGTLFIVDDARGLRRVTANGQSITTVRPFGGCTAGVVPLTGRGTNIVFDDDGNVIFSATISAQSGCAVSNATVGESLLYRFNPTTSTTTVIGGTGAAGATGDGLRADQTRFGDVRGIARDPTSGDIFISERARHTIRRIPGGVASGIVQTIVGTAGTSGSQLLAAPGEALLNQPTSLFFDEARGDLYVVDEGTDSLKVLIEP